VAGHDKVTPEGQRFFKELAELKKLQVRVGYQKGEKTTDEGVDLLDIAMWNELGTERSPARPFLRQSADANKAKIEKFCTAQLQSVAKGGTAQKALSAIGAMQVGLITDTITKSPGWAVPNAESTVKIKGSDVPLIDQSQLMQSPHYVIVPKGGGD
jgi:hypothetical protein